MSVGGPSLSLCQAGLRRFRLGNFTRGREILQGSESSKCIGMSGLGLATRVHLGWMSEGRIAEDPYRGLRAGPAFLPSAYFFSAFFLLLLISALRSFLNRGLDSVWTSS